MLLQKEYIYLFLLLLPVVSLLYASVGHGGASGYLALMALFSFEPELMKPTALLLNLFVAATSFYYYYKAGYFKLKLFLAFAITSIPLAFVGGSMAVDAALYKKILAVFLLFAILKMMTTFSKANQRHKKVKTWQGLIIGGLIGFFSGLIGIGGGIILSPVILLLDWGRMKEAAAVSALFIWVNSASGLIGQLSHGVVLGRDSFLFVFMVVIGGVIGGYLGSKKMNNQRLRYLLSFVLLIASIKLFFT